jgi:hypothetical protein
MLWRPAVRIVAPVASPTCREWDAPEHRHGTTARQPRPLWRRSDPSGHYALVPGDPTRSDGCRPIGCSGADTPLPLNSEWRSRRRPCCRSAFRCRTVRVTERRRQTFGSHGGQRRIGTTPPRISVGPDPMPPGRRLTPSCPTTPARSISIMRTSGCEMWTLEPRNEMGGNCDLNDGWPNLPTPRQLLRRARCPTRPSAAVRTRPEVVYCLRSRTPTTPPRHHGA